MLADENTHAAPESVAETVSPDGRIPFRLRIGVTGHRDLAESDELRMAVRSAVERAAAEIGYSPADRPFTPLKLTIFSALAEGADRLVVNEVFRWWPGSKLVCVLPVHENDLDTYLRDFESDNSREEFQHLCNRAWWRVFPGSDDVPHATQQTDRTTGYLWAGEEIARNCDVLIALWDGRPPRGTGGTADLIYRLRERDSRLTDAQPSTREIPPLEVPFLLDDTGPIRIIVSTSGAHDVRVDDDPPWNAGAAIVRKQLTGDLRDLGKLNRTKITDADWRRSAEQTADDLASPEFRNWPRLDAIFERITPALVRADQAAIVTHNWFLRSSYALYLSTAAATVIAALQAVVLQGVWELTIGEIILLIFSVVIVAAEKRWKNHERWLACRFLAERLRGACYLLAVGIAPHTGPDIGWTPDDPARNGWTKRAFTEVMDEQAPEPQEPSEPLEVLNSLIRVHWLGGQMSYFARSSRKMMRIHHMVRRSLYVVLGITIAAALVHSFRIWPFGSAQTDVLVMCAIGLPAVAGALSNIRSLREFSRHSIRYARMANVLHWYIRKFEQEMSIDQLRKLTAEMDGILTAEARGWLGVVSERGLEIHG
jgi:hypothetical protein